MRTIEEKPVESVESEAPARAPWQTPQAVTAEFAEAQGISSFGGDIYASSS